MVGGQVLDIEGEKKPLTLQELETVHLNKTGALLSFCIEAGQFLQVSTEDKTKQLKMFAHNIGLSVSNSRTTFLTSLLQLKNLEKLRE